MQEHCHLLSRLCLHSLLNLHHIGSLKEQPLRKSRLLQIRPRAPDIIVLVNVLEIVLRGECPFEQFSVDVDVESPLDLDTGLFNRHRDAMFVH